MKVKLGLFIYLLVLFLSESRTLAALLILDRRFQPFILLEIFEVKMLFFLIVSY